MRPNSVLRVALGSLCTVPIPISHSPAQRPKYHARGTRCRAFGRGSGRASSLVLFTQLLLLVSLSLCTNLRSSLASATGCQTHNISLSDPKLLGGKGIGVNVAGASETEDVPEWIGKRRSLFRWWAGSKNPKQVHIALAGPNSIRVMWSTSRRGTPSLVEFGLTSGQYTSKVKGKSSSYTFLTYSSDQLHSAVLSGLQPQTTYYYRIAGEGPERSFVTPPTDAAADVSIAVVGDIGLSKAARTTITRLSQQPHSLTLVPGDLSYANGFQSVWDRWQNLVEPDASTHPWMVVPGNHEAEALSAISPKGFEWPTFLKRSALLNGGAFRAYKKRWQMPSAASGSPSKLYYSFEVGGAHIIVLSCYSPFGPDSKQFDWLQKDLSSVDRTKTPWLIASLHEPWYHSNSDHQRDGQAMRETLEETLYAARVDMLITGHVHAYERTTRVYNGQEDPCGIMHITVGSGGKDLYPSFVSPRPAWSAFRAASFGFALFKIDGSAAGEADWVWHRNDDSPSVAADSARLVSLASSSAPAECRPL
ncbi:unnamed protein product [Closterium sp. Yama58-4]|nr:unnamed protein product [Closterium sp. Yama58-4]